LIITLQIKYTSKQGQYLAFIHYYTKINGRAPAEADMQRYFKVSPPSVHQMVITLERKKLINRTPGEARSIRILMPAEELPSLE
jgi:repressor LexA